MDAPLAAPLELEMLDRVGDIGAGAVHARLGQRLVQQLPRRPDEGPPGQILLVAGLLADEHQRRVQRAFAEHGLRRVLVERAAGAAHRLVAHRRPDRAAVAAPAGGPTAACRFAGSRGSAWRARRACDHRRLARLRARDQVGDQRRFGQVAPIFLGHFRQHRPGLEPGRVEDRGIIAFPQGLDRVAIGRIGTGRARPLAQGLAVPVDADRRGQDRPAHGGEAAHEKARIGADDMMLGFEPGDEAGAVVLLHLAKAHEGAHLVNVAPHRLGQHVDAPQQRIGLVLHQPRPVAQPHQQRIKQGEAFRIAVQDRRFRQIDEGARHREGGADRSRRQRRVAEQVAARIPDLPCHAVRFDPGDRQPPRRIAPAIHIVRRIQDDAVHGCARGVGGGGQGLIPRLGRAPVRRACARRTGRQAAPPPARSGPWRRRGTFPLPPPRYDGGSASSSARRFPAIPAR